MRPGYAAIATPCASRFSDDAVSQIASAGQVSPVSNRAVGVGEFRPP